MWAAGGITSRSGSALHQLGAPEHLSPFLPLPCAGKNSHFFGGDEDRVTFPDRRAPSQGTHRRTEEASVAETEEEARLWGGLRGLCCPKGRVTMESVAKCLLLFFVIR